MKRILLAGSAAAALMAMAAPASAQFVVSMRGDMEFTAGYIDRQQDTGLRDSEFANRFRVDIRADAKADNGLQYGVRLRLRALTNSSAAGGATVDYDRALAYASLPQFGRIDVGTIPGYSDGTFNTMWEYDQCQTSGGWDCAGNGGWQDFVSSNNANTNTDVSNKLPGTNVYNTLSRQGNATRFVYSTPVFNGFSASASYAPRVDSSGTDVNLVATTGIQDVYEIGALYDNKFGDIRFRVNGSYIGGSNPKLTSSSPANGYYSVQQYNAAIRVDYQGFAIGGGYVNDGKCTSNSCTAKQTSAGYFKADDHTVWNINAQYATGPLNQANTIVFGGGFLQARDSGTATVPGSRRLNDWQVAANYIIAPGLSQVFEYDYFTARSEGVSSSSVITKDEGSVFLLRTNLSF
ncbi:MAG: porin [Azospirillaceae bacterium]|nr:porin [Azospirillaceae bacterium]